MVGRTSVIILILIFFSFSLAAAERRPSLYEMLKYYKGIYGKPDYLLIEYDVYHPTKWVKRTYIWDGEFIVIFLWRKSMGWMVMYTTKKDIKI